MARTRAASVTAALVAGALALGAGTAVAVTTATAPATAAATSGSWSAVLVDARGADSTGRPLTLTWLIGIDSPQYVSVRNNGTLPLTAQTYTLTRAGGLATTVSAFACVGGTWNSGGSCVGGTQAQLGSTGSSVTNTVAVPLPVGGSVPVKVTNSLGLGTTVTLGVSTVRANTRAATTTSS